MGAGLCINAQVTGINTTNPHPSAMLDVRSNSVIGNQGVGLPQVYLSSITDKAVINGGAPADGLMVYNTNASLIGGKGIYFWSGAKQEWSFLVNQSNIDAFKNLTRYYTTTTQTSLQLPTTPSGSIPYVKDELITNGWTEIPALRMDITVDKPSNFANMRFSGTIVAYNPNRPVERSVAFGYGIFIDDKLVFGIADTTTFLNQCNYYNFYNTSVLENIAVGQHTVKFAIKVRRVGKNDPTNESSFPAGTVLTLSGTNTTCDNLNALESQTQATFYLNQNHK